MIAALSGIIRPSPKGFYCPEGDFFIDPRQPVAQAVITHTPADHAQPGSEHYLCAEPGKALIQTRMGREANIRSLAYGEKLHIKL